MKFTRRQTLALGAGAVATAAMGLPSASVAKIATADEAIAEFTGGAAIKEGGVTLTAPEIAENGNAVQVSVSAEGASAILIVADGNPSPKVATFTFGPLAGAPEASTRMRLIQTQNVTAVAKLADGSFAKASSYVKVTIGGCGG
ncbi:MAG: thiosulfate oxidation carrier protein SoxY [Neomegalonema sp.]|nr:thiosulfate oxidation carrier protein SoxY [Neomegalonema sp.]